MNIAIQIVNALFSFAALLNLPVRCRRLCKLYKKWPEDVGDYHSRQVTIELFNTGNREFTSQSTEAWAWESELIFDRLRWSTKHIILQALLWNSLFQIINQVFRCVYYSYELTARLPGKIWVNTFFPLAILTSIVAALIQVVAENRFLRENSLRKKQ